MTRIQSAEMIDTNKLAGVAMLFLPAAINIAELRLQFGSLYTHPSCNLVHQRKDKLMHCLRLCRRLAFEAIIAIGECKLLEYVLL